MPFSMLGVQFHRQCQLMDWLLLLLNGGVLAGCSPLLPSAGAAPLGCTGPPPQLCACGGGPGLMVPLAPGAAACCETSRSCGCCRLVPSSALLGETWEWELPLWCIWFLFSVASWFSFYKTWMHGEDFFSIQDAIDSNDNKQTEMSKARWVFPFSWQLLKWQQILFQLISSVQT